jgi:hypothetical protein
MYSTVVALMNDGNVWSPGMHFAYL